MLFREIIAVYTESNKNPYIKYTALLILKAPDIYLQSGFTRLMLYLPSTRLNGLAKLSVNSTKVINILSLQLANVKSI
jgi:hypothetical protein